MVPCTLGRYRDVYRAWKGIRAPGRVSYSVMRALADHPDREQLVKDNPLTQGEARKIMRAYKDWKAGKEDKPEASSDEWGKDKARWFKNLVAIAHKLRGAADIGRVTPAHLKEIEPKLLPELREVGEVLINLVDGLRAHWDREQEFEGAAPPTGRKRFTAPVNDAAQAQAGAA
jgi:hypothetical protein